MKTCTRCKTNKEFTQFGPSRSNRDGYDSHCKECRNEAARLKRQAIKDDTYIPIAQIRAERGITKYKTCSVCKEEKPRSKFGRNKTTWDGLYSCCKVCKLKQTRKLRREAKIVDPLFNRKNAIKQKYGLTWDQFEALAENQNNLCGICKQTMKTPFVDHCHETGKIRGLLCSQCNTGIGMLKDDPVIIGSALIYVQEARLSSAK